MIRPLRVRHRWMTGILFLAVPAVLLLALRGRAGVPVYSSLPSQLSADQPPLALEGSGLETVLELEELGVTVRATVSMGTPVLEVSTTRPLAAPDVLIYWSATAATDSLPENAVLLGAYSDRPRLYAVSERAATRPGFLVFYSLGHQKVVAGGPLPKLVEPLEPTEGNPR